MDTKGITNFIDFVYSRNKTDLIAEFRENENSFHKWESELRAKRDEFESCFFDCICNDNDGRFESMLLIKMRKLKNTIQYYEDNLDLTNQPQDDDKKIEWLYDVIRYSEIAGAVTNVDYYLRKLHNNPTANTQTTATTNTTATTDVCVGEDKPLHYEGGYTDENLNYIYEYLTKGRYIDRNTKLEDLIYYFSGRGNPPQEKIKWTASAALLSLFVMKIFKEDKNKWKIANKIFTSDRFKECSARNYQNVGEAIKDEFDDLQIEVII